MGCQESVSAGESFHTKGTEAHGAESVFGSGVHVGRMGNVNLSFRRMTYLDGGTVKMIMEDELKRTATSLQLNGNLLYTLGKELVMLPHLQQIDLEGNKFQRVPEILTQMTKLWRINLSCNPLDSKGFTPLTRIQGLKSIALRRCELKAVPEPLFRCAVLEELDLSGNEALVISNSPLTNIKRLKALYISECNLGGSTLPVGLLNVTTLEKLDISDNHFDFSEMNFFGTKLPLTLNVLHLRNLNLSAVPQSVASLRQLHTLDLSQNPIQTLDVLAGRLVKRFASPSSAVVSSPPSQMPLGEDTGESASAHSGQMSLSKLSKAGRIASVSQPIPLKRLSLQGCGLRTVPKYFHKLTCLEELDLSDNNELDDPNMTLFSLEKLRVLNVVGCPFADDPSKSRNEWYDIGKLRSLTRLDWEVWKGTSNISAYRTKVPIEICGLPLTSINEVQLRRDLFVNDSLETIINLVRDGYFKVDLAMDESTVYSHIEALKIFELGRRFFFPNDSVQMEALKGETKGIQKEERAARKLLEDVTMARFRVSLSRYIFFLTVQAANYDAIIIPPMDVMIMHYAHIVINPARYRADCEAICGRILNCNYRTFFLDSARYPGAAKDSVLASKKVWNLMARTTQEGLVWLHYDFWYKRGRRQNDSNIVATPASGIRRLPVDPFPTLAAATSEYQEISKLNTAQDLNGMLDQAITAHFHEQGVDVFRKSVESMFNVSKCFFACEAQLDDLSVDWPRYVKYLSLYALQNSRRHESTSEDVVIESLADVPMVFEPMVVRRNTSILGKRYDQLEHRDGGAGGGRYQEVKPSRGVSFLSGSKKKTTNAAIQCLRSNPVPTIGIVYLLHAHRTAHVKYFQILTLFGIEADDITWENTKVAADDTSKAWDILYEENYVGGRKNVFLYEVDELRSAPSGDTAAPLSTYQPSKRPVKSCLSKSKKGSKKQVSLSLGGDIM